MTHFHRIILSAAIALMFLSSTAAQTVYINGLPRDTSFTLRQTYNKEKKYRPFIKPVFAKLPQGVAAYEGLVYSVISGSPYEKRELHVNLYRPDDSKMYPAMIMVHGGGWNSGDLTLQVPLAQKIATFGYVTIPVEYRLIPEAKYPAGMHDLKACVRWVRANAARYGIDPNRIAISGCSAGAQLAALIGTTGDRKEYEGAGGNPSVSSKIQAVISIDGITDFATNESIDRARKAKEERKPLPVDALWLGGTYEDRAETWKEASALYQVSRQSPPICFINSSIPRFHNGRDEMIAKLNEWHIYSEVHTIPDTPHPFWFFEPWFDTTVGYAVAFLDKIFQPAAPATKEK